MKWIKEVSSKATKQAIMNGDKAFRDFFKKAKDFPRFKKKKNQDVKAYFPKNNKTDWTIERHRVKIPTLGWVRLKEYIFKEGYRIIESTNVAISRLKKMPETVKRNQLLDRKSTRVNSSH